CPSVLTLLSSHAAKRIIQVKRCLQWSSRRKASLKTHTPSIKSKKARLFSHYHRSVEKPTISSDDQGSQNLEVSPETSEIPEKSLTSSQ
ncbi:hypothetical protein E2I00_007963, partial [Balaenoptera physalus]